MNPIAIARRYSWGQDAGMPKKKAARKPFKYVRIKDPAASLALKQAKGLQRTLASWVTEAVIEKLKREGLWELQPEDKESA